MVKIKLVIVFGCKECNKQFDKHSDFIDHLFVHHNKYNCKKRAINLCENDDCELCFNRSFSSHYRVKRVHPNKNGDTNFRYVCRNSNKKYWFVCPECNHDFDKKPNHIISESWCPYCASQKLCEDECEQCYNKSFASVNKKEHWHPNKNFDENGNLITPRDVFKHSNNTYWFICPYCNHDFDSGLDSITNGHWCPYCCYPPKNLCEDNCDQCFNKSFASIFREKDWHKTKNGTTTPREVFKSSNNVYWFKCPDCNHDFDSVLADITKGSWCPYCSAKKLCEDECEQCYNKSFASVNKNEYWHRNKNFDENGNLITPRDVFKNSANIYWFKCPNCDHDFESSPNHITYGQWCPYCSSPPQKMCKTDCNHCFNNSFSSFFREKDWHSNKNFDENGKLLTPRDVFRGSNNVYWFICPDCNNDYKASLNSVISGKWCNCTKNKTETILYKYLLTLFSNTTKQFKPEWCRHPDTNKFLPLDFCMEELKLIVELDGRQHHKQVSNWGSPKETQLKDMYKAYRSLENGYTIIRLYQPDVFDNKIEWKQLLQKVVKTYNTPQIIILSDKEEFNYFNDVQQIVRITE